MDEEMRFKMLMLHLQHIAAESQCQRARATGRLGGLATARNRKLRNLQKYYRDGIL
jgi:hypothetical protein